jgi:hypothetical protein
VQALAGEKRAKMLGESDRERKLLTREALHWQDSKRKAEKAFQGSLKRQEQAFKGL